MNSLIFFIIKEITWVLFVMNVQSTGAVSVNQSAAEQAGRGRPPLVSAAIRTGKVVVYLAAAEASTMIGRMVDNAINRKIPGTRFYRRVPGEFHSICIVVGYAFMGLAIGHGLSAMYYAAKTVQSMGDRLSSYLVETTGCTPLVQESCAVKACACFGAAWSVFAGRELMHSLVGITNPFPDSVSCRAITACSKEVINDSILVVLGAGTGYLVGKGAEYAVEKACVGIDMAARGAASILARPDVMIEPG